MAAARQEHLLPGREIHLTGMRGSRFFEVGLITGTDPDQAVANSWNTTGCLTRRLSRRLEPPAGWGFRAETLDQDMEVTSNRENLVHVVHDDLRNDYLGSDVGRAFSLLVPRGYLW